MIKKEFKIITQLKLVPGEHLKKSRLIKVLIKINLDNHNILGKQISNRN